MNETKAVTGGSLYELEQAISGWSDAAEISVHKSAFSWYPEGDYTESTHNASEPFVTDDSSKIHPEHFVIGAIFVASLVFGILALVKFLG